MSDLEELNKSLYREKKKCDNFVNKTKNLVDLVPNVLERKQG